jgi:uncharacterized protein YndB with AHSA1/START domain
MLKALVVILGVGLAGVLAYAATRPDSFKVQRSIVIEAPPERIYAMIHDFRRWTEWSPYESLDADLVRVYGGAAAGTGATYAWQGRKAGAGDMEILSAEPSSRILIRLAFTKPMEAVNTAEFALAPAAGGTRVTWSMYGPMTFVSKLFGLVFNMDEMLGKDFEKGLSALKAGAERT